MCQDRQKEKYKGFQCKGVAWLDGEIIQRFCIENIDKKVAQNKQVQIQELGIKIAQNSDIRTKGKQVAKAGHRLIRPWV